MLKKLALATALLAGLGTAHAYQAELNVGYENTDIDNVGDLDTFFINGKYYLNTVQVKNSPLAEAAFLNKASNIGLGYANASGDGDEDIDVFGVSGEFYIPNTQFYVSGTINQVDFAGEDNTGYAFEVGYLPVNGLLLAAGLTLKKENFAEFKQVFEVLIGAMDEDLFTATLWTDGELPASAFHIETVDLLQNLSPWGQKFPQPIFDGVFKIMDYRWLKDVHLKLRVALENGQVVDAIAFNAADKYDFDPMKDTRLVYELDKNVFNGNVSLQMRIIHLEQ